MVSEIMSEQRESISQNLSGPIGYIVGGGLKANLQARLNVPAQNVQEGAFVVVESGGWLFYGLVTDLQLGSTDPRFADEQTETRLPAQLARLLHGQTLFTNLEIMTALMMERGPEPGSPEYDAWFQKVLDEQVHPEPVKTVPQHHAEVRLADAGDIAKIFGKEGEKSFFRIGNTIEGGHPVCVNLDKLVQRSSGIFGATGSGKSFLTRVILAGLIKRDKTAVLIFDMHNEYGPDDTASDTGLRVPGLRGKFPAKVRMVGLGAGASIRGNNPDFTLEIAEADITPEDVLMLSQELNLRETTATTLEALRTSFGYDCWFQAFKHMQVNVFELDDDSGKRVPAEGSVAAWAEGAGVHPNAAEALHSKLRRLFNAPYIVEQPASNALQQMIENLDNGQHVVLSFGKHETDLDYLFVSNLLTRRIREVWERRTNAFRSGHQGAAEPRPLVIVVEEAHKLLNREMASQTTFSTIAREMRKYYVTLLIIDQRPSQIYDEVMSQLGTRVTGWLDDADDIQAVLTGLAGRDSLRGMLARLQPKEEVLMLGWGVPMPILVRSRRYDDEFWEDLLGKSTQRSEREILDELGF
jgi:hypothetical protein